MRVARAGDWLHLVATRAARAGEVVCPIEGALVERPTRHTIQLDEAAHIEAAEELTLEQMVLRYPWRFTNHSCDPNARVAGRSLVAMKPVRAGDEITYNYNTTEWELAEPFECRCGSPYCERTIRGFRYLSREERERIRPLLAPHLLARMDATEDAARP